MIDLPSRPPLDDQNPYPGPPAFEECDADYFFGRASEAEELYQCVRRGALTVLYGESGLGKSSLLQAGLFPRLRAEGHAPLFIRVAYPAKDDPLAQVRAQIAEQARLHGIEAPPPNSEQTLWEYFQRTPFFSGRSRLVLPVLVIDQFEERFTVGSAREGAEEWITELADVVENRIPAALRRAVEEDSKRLPPRHEAIKVKVILALREEYLPHLRDLRRLMPSLAFNELHLHRMSGERALEAVRNQRTENLIEPAVARRLVEFVALAGRSATATNPDALVDLARLKIEPSLLSLVARELNERRKVLADPDRRTRIDAELVRAEAGNVIAGFYERCFAGLDPRVKEFVEERLVTTEGHRTTYALPEALKRPGVDQAAIDQLMERRLVRVEDRGDLGTKHVELIHDVLTREAVLGRERRLEERAVADARAADAARRSAAEAAQSQRNKRRATWALGAIVAVGLAIAYGVSRYNQRATALAEARIAREAAVMLKQEARQSLSVGDRDDAARLLALAYTEAEAGDAVTPGLQLLVRRTLNDLQAREGVLEGHAGVIRTVHWCEDGTTLATGGDDGKVILWSYDPRGRALKKDATLDPFGAPETAGASPATSARADSQSTPAPLGEDKAGREAGLYAQASRAAALRVGGSQETGAAATHCRDAAGSRKRTGIDEILCTRDWLVAFASDGSGTVWTRAGKRVDCLGGLASTTDEGRASGDEPRPIRAMLSGEGTPRRLVAWRDGSEPIQVWDVAERDGSPLSRPRPTIHFTGSAGMGDPAEFERIATRQGLSPQRRKAAWASWQEGWTHLHRILADVAIDRAGRRLATAGSDGKVRVWNLDEDPPKLAFPELDHADVRSIAITSRPSGPWLATGGLQEVRLFDASGRLERKLPQTSDVRRVWLPDGDAGLVVAFASGPGLGIDPLTGRVLKVFRSGTDPALFAVDSNRLDLVATDGVTTVWSRDLVGGAPPAVLSFSRATGTAGWDVSPDRKTLVTYGKPASIAEVWSVDRARAPSGDRVLSWGPALSQRPLSERRSHQGAIYAMTASSDGRWVVTGGSDGKVCLHEAVEDRLSTCRLLGRHGAAGSRSRVTGVSISPQGRYVASVGADGRAMAWVLASGARVPLATGQAELGLRLAFHPDERSIVIGERGGRLCSYSLPGGAKGACQDPCHAAITSIAFDRDGKRLAAGCWTGEIAIEAGTLEKSIARLAGSQDRIRHLQFSRDGARLLSASSEGTACAYDLATTTRTLTIRHGDPVNFVAWSGSGPDDDRSILTAGDGGKLALWSRDGQLQREFDASGRGLAWATLDAESGIVTAAGGGSVWYFPRDGGAALEMLRPGMTSGHIRATLLSGSGNLVTATEDGMVRLYRGLSSYSNAPLADAGHGEPVIDAAFSRDGRWLASADEGGAVRVWDVTNGRQTAGWEGALRSNGRLAFLGDGRLRAIGHDGGLVDLDPSGAGGQTRAPPIRPGIGQLAASPEFHQHTLIGDRDGDRALAVDQSLRVQLMKAGEAQPTPPVALRSPLHLSMVFDAAFSEDGQSIFTAGGDGRIGVWSSADPARGELIPVADDWLLRFEPAGPGTQTLLVRGDHSLTLWSAVTKQPVSPAFPYRTPGAFFNAAISPDAQSLVLYLGDHLQFIDRAGAARGAGIPEYGSILRFSPTGSMLLAADPSSSRARVYDGATGTPASLPYPGDGSRIRDAQFTLDGKSLALAEQDQFCVWPWEPEDGKAAPPECRAGGRRAVALTADERKFVVLSDSDEIQLVEAGAHLLVRQVAHLVLGERAALFPSPDRLRVAVIARDGVVVYQTPDLAPVIDLPDPQAESIRWSPDGKQLLSTGVDGMIRRWDIAGAKLAHTFDYERFVAAAWTVNGPRVITSHGNGELALWDGSTGKPWLADGGTIRPGKAVTRVVLSHDGSRLAAALEGGGLTVWPLGTLRPGPPRDLGPAASGSITALAISDDGQRTIAGERDGSLRLWDGTELRTLRGHEGAIRTASFSPRDEFFITGSDDGTARVWDARRGLSLVVLRGQPGSVRVAIFSPDGHRVATGGDHGWLRVWDLSPIATKGDPKGMNAEKFSEFVAHATRSPARPADSGGDW